MIYLDFETRSECDLKKCGAWVYAEHPSTSIICMAWALNDGPTHLWEPGHLEIKQMTTHEIAFNELLATIKMGAVVEAHSAFFERAIWENICVKRMGWPPVKDSQWRCSAARVAARALPRSLAGAAAALNVQTQKDMGGRQIMLKVSKPRKAVPGEISKTIWEDDIMDLWRVYEYCKKDVESERDVTHAVRPLPENELKVWQLDQKMNLRGVLVDREGCQAAIKIMAELKRRLTEEFVELTKGKLKTVGQRDRLLEWLEDEGTSLTAMTKAEVLVALGGELSGTVRRVLEIRQQLSRTSVAKFQAMLNASGRDGRIRDMLLYHGAGTGRWAGRLVQLQNLVRGTVEVTEESIKLLKTGDLDKVESFYPDVAGFVSSCIRGMLIAAPGKQLIAADYSAIEARVLFWLADETKGLQLYREKQDLYIRMAGQIYPAKTIGKTERGVGKTTILGCGYSMGAKKFRDTLKNNERIEITEVFAKYIVDTYRSTFPAVPRLWYAQEAAAVRAVRNPNTPFPCGKVTWGYNRKEDVLYCELPSKRLLAYNSPKIKPSARFEGKLELSCMVVSQGQWVRESTYGGKLVENITQATARDIMAHAMLRLEEAGYPLVLSVHDEIVAEVPEKQGPMELFLRIMTTLPEWAAGCPIEAEGWIGARYAKH